MKPRKLIRHKVIEHLKEGEWEIEEDKDKLNELYSLKIMEELGEIISSDHKDINEFVDLLQVAFAFARHNGFTYEQLSPAMFEKSVLKGNFRNTVLTNMNPDNPSNSIYFKTNQKQ